MAGTILNVVGILVGGVTGLVRKSPMSASTQGTLKLLLGLATILAGLRLLWVSFAGEKWSGMILLLVIVVASMSLGRLVGRLLRLQHASNRLGHFTRERMEAVQPGKPTSFSDGFNACSAVFCVAPLGIIGAVTDGLSGHWQPLAVKAVMDGLATMGFVTLFGAASIAAALPVLAFQGSIAMVCRLFVGPWLLAHGLVTSVNATAGVLLFAVALVILESKRIELTDYLPSLAVAPLLMWALNTAWPPA